MAMEYYRAAVNYYKNEYRAVLCAVVRTNLLGGRVANQPRSARTAAVRGLNEGLTGKWM